MPDVKLSDGRELTFDLHRVTMRQMRKLFEDGTSVQDQDGIIGAALGMTGQQVSDLPYPDYRLVMSAFLRKASEPIADPNSPSESTSV